MVAGYASGVRAWGGADLDGCSIRAVPFGCRSLANTRCGIDEYFIGDLLCPRLELEFLLVVAVYPRALDSRVVDAELFGLGVDVIGILCATFEFRGGVLVDAALDTSLFFEKRGELLLPLGQGSAVDSVRDGVLEALTGAGALIVFFDGIGTVEVEFVAT
jgi:hypothetical protein